MGTSSFIVDYYDLDDVGRLKMTFEKYAELLSQQRTLEGMSGNGNNSEDNKLWNNTRSRQLWRKSQNSFLKHV